MAANNAPQFNPDGSLRRRAGRPPSATWALLTDTPNAHKLPSAVCKSCKREVNYHKKREAAETHLNKCPQFWETMMALPPERRPDWFGVKKQQKPAPTAAGSAAAGTTSGAPSATTGTATGAKRKLKGDDSAPSAKREKHANAGTLVLASAPFTSSAPFQELLAMHFYATSTPLMRVADSYLAQAIATLRPEAQLPTPDMLVGPLLDTCYQTLQAKTALLLGASGTNACVVSADVGAMTHFVAATPRKTLFLHTDRATQRTSEAIAAGIASVMTSITGHGVVVGAVTANTPAHMRAWTMLSKQFPSRFFHGCVSHLVHLVLQDLFDSERNEGADDVEAFKLASLGKSPFKSSLVEFATDCRDVISFFAARPLLSVHLETRQRAANAQLLQQTTLLERFTTLRASESHLSATVRDKAFAGRALSAKEQTERQRVRNIVTHANFVENLDKALCILQPLDKILTRFERANVPVSEVVPAFQELTQMYTAHVASAQLSESEGDYLSALVAARLGFFRREAHDFGYLLDPRYLGDHLLISQRRETEDALFAFPADDSESASVTETDALVTADEFTNFSVFARADRSAHSTHYQLMVQGKRSPLQFWQLEGVEWPRLQKIALKVFAMAASTASATRDVAAIVDATERADVEDAGSATTDDVNGDDAISRDAAFGGDATPTRVRVTKTPEALEKLVYIRANAQQLADISSASDDSSAEPRGHYYYESEDIAII